MMPGRLSDQIRARQERSEIIVRKLQDAGWDVALSDVLRHFPVFDRWASGLISTGYLQKMVSIRRKPLNLPTIDATAGLQRQLNQAGCECVDVKKAVEVLGPIASHIRSMTCDDCGRMLYVSDLIGAE